MTKKIVNSTPYGTFRQERTENKMEFERVLKIIIEKEQNLSRLAWNYVQSNQIKKAQEIELKLEALNDLFWALLDEKYGVEE